MALNNAIFQLIHGLFVNVLFANVLSHFTYVLGRFSYFFRLICGWKNEAYACETFVLFLSETTGHFSVGVLYPINGKKPIKQDHA